jgi:hypothetical protein
MAEFGQALEGSTNDRKIRAARVNLEMIENDAIPVECIQARQAAGETAEQFERLSRLQQRLEASIDKAMRELERLRAGRWRRGEHDDSDPESLATLQYQLDREDLLEISAREVRQAKRTARKIETVRNEATVAEEADKLRVKQGLEEDDEASDTVGDCFPSPGNPAAGLLVPPEPPCYDSPPLTGSADVAAFCGNARPSQRS